MTKIIKEYLIQSLAPGKFVSGQKLGNELNVSRAAIAKHMATLVNMGLDVFSVRGKGYKLSAPLSLLNKDDIAVQLSLTQSGIIEVHSVIDSTNDYLMRRLPNQITQGQVCLAEYQSAGRGRRGRQWISPFGSQIYLSMYWYLEQGLSAAMGLSVAAALAVSDAILLHCGVQVQLKWPNDIYLGGVKLAGILIELEGQALDPSHSVIGIGLNINLPEKSVREITQQCTDLHAHSPIEIDRNLLSAQLISCLWKRLAQHSEHGLIDMLSEWHAADIYLNKRVKLITGDKEILGICRGLNNHGALLLEVDGKVKPIYGGEVSLRGNE